MSNDEPKISKNRQKKMAVVASLEEKLAKSAAIVFTNYQGLTHKQLEGLKKAIKPMNAEFVVAKNSLIIRALNTRKIKLENQKDLDGQTGTLFIYEDLVSPLKELAKLIKELGIPSVKFGIMEGNKITGEEVLRLSTLPSREVLLSQVAAGLKAPIYGLHRALNWNLQKFVMALNAVAKAKPSDAEPIPADPVTKPSSQPAQEPSEKAAEPETILAETAEEKAAEQPENPQTEQKTEETPQKEPKNEGGEN